ncbi:MAG: rod shape-determining protein MreC [Rhodospirillales bacterium]
MTGLLKSLGLWIVYGGLLLAAAAVMVLGRADPPLVERLRLQVTDAVVPILDVLSRPVDGLTRAAEQVQSWTWLAEENTRLKAEREQLLQWQAVARRLEAENASLRSLLNYVPDPAMRSVAARVIANSTSAFAHSVVVNAGSNDGVSKGQMVVTGEGMAGRVATVSPRAALVLLITDLNSRVPVFVGASRAMAILAGDNSERPRLIHRIGEGAIAPGDIVVTSGLAGGLPPGQPIGVIDDDAGTVIRVRPFVDRSRLEFVRLVAYDAPASPSMPGVPADGKGKRTPGGGTASGASGGGASTP